MNTHMATRSIPKTFAMAGQATENVDRVPNPRFLETVDSP